MPKIEQIYTMMQKMNTPYIRVYNMDKQRLFTFDSHSDVSSTLAEMESLMPYIAPYRKVIIEAADDKIKRANYASSYKWICEFDSSPIGTPAQNNTWPGAPVPPGYVHQDVMAANLKRLEDKIDHAAQIRALEDKIKEKDTADPMKNIERLAPAILYLFGKQPDEIAKISGLFTQNTQPQQQRIAGPQTMTLTFSDVEKMTSEEKSKRCQELANELANYVSVEEMIILQSKLIDKLKVNPKFMETVFLYI